MKRRETRQLRLDFSGAKCVPARKDPVEATPTSDINVYRLNDLRRRTQLEDVRARLRMTGVFMPRREA